MKICIKCNIEKPISEFYTRKSSKDGYRNDCKSCTSERGKQYRQVNKDKITVRNKQYIQANKDKVAEKSKQYRQANKDKKAEYYKHYYQVNKTKIAERVKQYQQANKDKKAEYYKHYYQKNKDTLIEYAKDYRKTSQGKLVDRSHYHKRRIQKINNTPSGNNFTNKDVKQKLKLQKHKCVYCKESLKDYFEVDHIIALTNGGSNEASNIQLLCKLCNGNSGKGTKDITEFAEKHGMLF